MMGNGTATGDSRAREAAESAVKSPLLADIDFTGASVLVNIAASSDITMGEFSEVGQQFKNLPQIMQRLLLELL